MRQCDNEEAYAYMLHCLPGFGNRTLGMLYEEFGSCRAICEAGEKELRSIITKRQTDTLLNAKNEWDPEGEYRDLFYRGIDFYPVFSEKYPERLRSIPDPPFAIYCIGELPDEERYSVAIIGARTGSEYGRHAAKMFGEGLAARGIQVISGMARGIDGIGQYAALCCGGDSYAVLGSGVDVCYPDENHILYDRLKGSGGIISEYPPGTPPRSQNFPPRNRIISGLSDAVVVIEARIKSGTLITVDMALEQGRDVFAVPGRICDDLSSGCNCLIKQGAVIATTPDDVAEYLRKCTASRTASDKACVSTKKMPVHRELSDIQRMILSEMDIYPKTPTDIFERMLENGMEISVSEVMNVLVELCMTGAAAQKAGGFYATMD